MAASTHRRAAHAGIAANVPAASRIPTPRPDADGSSTPRSAPRRCRDRLGETGKVGELGCRRRTHRADGVGNVGKFARQNRCDRLVDVSHLTAEPTAVSKGRFTSLQALRDVSPTPDAGSLTPWMKCWNANGNG